MSYFIPGTTSISNINNRVGINSLSRPLDFDLSVNTEEYKEIQNFTIIFFIRQHTG